MEKSRWTLPARTCESGSWAAGLRCSLAHKLFHRLRSIEAPRLTSHLRTAWDKRYCSLEPALK